MPQSQPRTLSALRSLLTIGFLMGASTTSAQGAAKKGAAPAKGAPVPTETLPTGQPSLTDTVGYLTRGVAEHPSLLRPCKAAANLEISPDGLLSLTTTRQAYCEDSRLIVHLTDLDPSTVQVVREPVSMLVVSCREGAACATAKVRRKSLTPAGWILRDADWVPGVLAEVPASQKAVEIVVEADSHTLSRMANGLRYLLTSGAAAPEYQLPIDPFVAPPPPPIDPFVAPSPPPSGTPSGTAPSPAESSKTEPSKPASKT